MLASGGVRRAPGRRDESDDAGDDPLSAFIDG